LVQSAESKIIQIGTEMKLKQNASISVQCTMEMGVINLREDLFPWYNKLGYETLDRLPHDEELRRIVLEDVDVYCVLMRKELGFL
jgi:hypothetical protein